MLLMPKTNRWSFATISSPAVAISLLYQHRVSVAAYLQFWPESLDAVLWRALLQSIQRRLWFGHLRRPLLKNERMDKEKRRVQFLREWNRNDFKEKEE